MLSLCASNCVQLRAPPQTALPDSVEVLAAVMKFKKQGSSGMRPYNQHPFSKSMSESAESLQTPTSCHIPRLHTWHGHLMTGCLYLVQVDDSYTLGTSSARCGEAKVGIIPDKVLQSKAPSAAGSLQRAHECADGNDGTVTGKGRHRRHAVQQQHGERPPDPYFFEADQALVT